MGRMSTLACAILGALIAVLAFLLVFQPSGTQTEKTHSSDLAASAQPAPLTLATSIGQPSPPSSSAHRRPLPKFALKGVSVCSQAEMATAAIDPLSGKLMMTVTDLAVAAGPADLQVRRSLLPRAMRPGLLGTHWRLNWEKRLVRSADLAVISEGAGWTVFAPDPKSSQWRSVEGEELVFDSGRATRRLLDGTEQSYDGQGRLTRIEDPNGNLTLLTYAPSGQLERIDGPANSFLVFETRSDGLLASIKGSDGATVNYYFGDSQLPAGLGDRDGSVLYSYDAEGLLNRIQQPGFRPMEFTYDDQGRVVERHRQGWGRERLEYDDVKKEAKRTSSDGSVTTTRWTSDLRRIAVVDRRGDRRVTFYDSNHRPVEVRERLGQTTLIRYDQRGRKAEIESPRGRITRIEYLGRTGLPRRVTHPDSSQITYSYDDRKNLIELRHGDQPVLQLTYHPNGLVATIKQQGQSERRFEYDEQGRLVSVHQPTGTRIQLTYDARGNLVRRVNSLGHTTTWEYDELNRLVSHTDPAGHETHWSYQANGQLSAIRDSRGGVTRFAYDDLGRRIKVTDPEGKELRKQYDAIGRVTEVQTLDGEEWTYTYGPSGNLTELCSSGGSRWTYQYDDHGRLLRETGPLEHERSFQYNAWGQLVATVDALGRITTYEYNATGDLAAVRDPMGRVVRRQYDDDARWTATVDWLGRQTSINYNQFGQISGLARNSETLLNIQHQLGYITRIAGPSGSAVTFSRDQAGRTEAKRYANGECYRFERDGLGRVIEATDGRGHSWQAEYTSGGKLAKFTSPSQNAFRYRYTPRGQLERLVDPLGRVRNYQYDSRGRRTGKVDALGRASSITYASGLRISSVERPDGQIIRRKYDALGRLVEVHCPGVQPARFRYDPVGNLIEETRGDYRASYRYDALDRLVEATYQPLDCTVNYEYDEAGRRCVMRVSGVGAWLYRYDENDRLIELEDPRGGTARFAYDQAGRVTRKTLPNGIVVQRSYDARGRMLKLTAADPKGTTILDRSFRYDVAGNLVEAVREQGESSEYQYDAEDRLIEVAESGQQNRLLYDAVGNHLLTADRARYDAADQVVHFGDERFEYDACGRMIRRHRGEVEVEYAYGVGGQITEMKRNGATQVAFGYDPQGRRIWKQGSGQERHYLYDGNQLLLEMDEAGNAVRIWTPGPEPDRPISVVQRGEPLYLVNDRIGSLSAITDAAAKVTARMDFKPFGTQRQTADSPHLPLPIGFAGSQYDAETGLCFFRSRYYDPRLARFLTPDPAFGQLSNPPSLHPYQYCYNNPLRYRDLSGATAADIADAATDTAGSVAHTVGYYAGQAAFQTALSPVRAWNWMTGDTAANQRLDQAADEFSRHVSGVALDTVASTATSVATEPLRLGSGLGNASVDVEQGNYGAAVLHTAADAGRAFQVGKAASAVGRTSIAAARTLQAPVTQPSGPVSSAMREAFVREAQSPGFRRLADTYAKAHGKTIDWPGFTRQLENATYRGMTRSEILRTGGGFAGANPSGSGWLMSAVQGLKRIPVTGNALHRQAIRHEALHAVQDHLWGVFSRESGMGFLARQQWEIVPSLMGDPAIKVIGGGGLFAGVYTGAGSTIQYGPDVLDWLSDRGQRAGDRSIDALINELSDSNPSPDTTSPPNEQPDITTGIADAGSAEAVADQPDITSGIADEGMAASQPEDQPDITSGIADAGTAESAPDEPPDVTMGIADAEVAGGDSGEDEASVTEGVADAGSAEDSRPAERERTPRIGQRRPRSPIARTRESPNDNTAGDKPLYAVYGIHSCSLPKIPSNILRSIGDDNGYLKLARWVRGLGTDDVSASTNPVSYLVFRIEGEVLAEYQKHQRAIEAGRTRDPYWLFKPKGRYHMDVTIRAAGGDTRGPMLLSFRELISGTLPAAYRQARIRLFAIDLATIKNPRSLSSKQSPGGGWRFEGGLDEQRMTCTVGPLEYDQANRWQKQTLDKVLALGKLAMLAGAGAGGAFGEAFQGFGGSF